VNVVPTGGTSAQASVTRAEEGETVSLPFGVASDAGLSLDQLSVTATETDYDVEVTAATTAPGDVPSPADAVGFLTVEHSVADANVTDATFRFGVDATTLSERGTDPDAVALLRRTNGSWTELATDHRGTENGTHRFTAGSPGFSVFAVATPAASDLSVTNATLNRSDAARAEPVGVTATLANDGSMTATRRLNVTANGSLVANETATVPPHDTRTVTVPVGFARTGTYALAVDSVTSGTLTGTFPVDTHEPSNRSTANSTATTLSPDPNTAPSRGSESGTATDDRSGTTTDASGPGFTPLVALVALALAALAAARRQP
jgi:PGF-pre-PGF domain-containing protein/PGF-CTERM protein